MISRTRIRLVAFIALAALMVVPSLAFASEHDEEEEPTADEAPRFDAVVGAAYDDMLRLLIFAINAADAKEPVDCSIPEGVVLSRGDDAEPGSPSVTVAEGDWEVPEGCTIVDVEGPNGQVNHGQVVSNFVHALKALDRSMIDVPFGQLVRQIAGSDLGRATQLDGDDADDDSGDDDSSQGPPPHANNDKDKGPKGNNGNGRGPRG